MSFKQKIITLLSFLVFILPALSMAHAQTIAVFPMDNLSKGKNSPNMIATRYMAGKMKEKGLQVIQEQKIINFMVSKRIRWLGYLSTENILQTKEIMGADLVLFGTIISNKHFSSYGLILHLVRTRDAKTIWTSSDGLSLVDMQRLLGRNQPATLDGLWHVLVSNVLASWPDDLSEVLNKP
jgi:hypothetical protein